MLKKKMKSYYDELLEETKGRKLSKDEFNKLKIRICRKYNVKSIPTDIEFMLNTGLGIITKPSRTVSGVAVVAVMTKPMKCPHGRCIYCPGGVDSEFGNVPQSYTGKEPAARRAARAYYDPYLQVFNRLEQYTLLNQPFDKVELIIMGGTFPSFPKRYQEEFVMYCLKALNDFSQLFFINDKINIKKFKELFELPGDFKDKERVKRVQQKILRLKKKSSLLKEQKTNEKSKIRCIGLTIETRPDYGMLTHAEQMLRLGATRVEVGVQSIYDDVLKRIGRGHNVAATIKSFRILKDLGFKINAHIMLGLPGSTKEKDISCLRELFANPDFRPDMLKIYPCMVLKGTKLYELWKHGNYKPLTTGEAAEIIATAKKFIPPYVRIMRIQRDIPTGLTDAGVDRTNLRQYVKELMKQKGIKCHCIRCREIGRGKKKGKVRIKVLQYEASRGIDFFISAEDEENIYGFCRLRFPSQQLRKEITRDTAVIRELHVYGPATTIGKKEKGKRQVIQHKGIGRKLLAVAEGIAIKNGKKSVIVISGVGAREYYRKLGYRREGVYMKKRIR